MRAANRRTMHLNNFSVERRGDRASCAACWCKADREERLTHRRARCQARRLDRRGRLLGRCHPAASVGAQAARGLYLGVARRRVARLHRPPPKGIEETERFADPRRPQRGAAGPPPRRDQRARPARRAPGAAALRPAAGRRSPSTHEAREWLECAAWLHDVGHHIDHKNHQRHSYYLITNGELLGFRRDELEIIGLTARYHRKAAPKDADAELSARCRRRRPPHGARAERAFCASPTASTAATTASCATSVSLRRGERADAAADHRRRRRGSEIWEAKQRAGLLGERAGP